MSTASFPPPAGETPADEEQTSQRPPTQTSIHIGKQARKASKQASNRLLVMYIYPLRYKPSNRTSPRPPQTSQEAKKGNPLLLTIRVRFPPFELPPKRRRTRKEAYLRLRLLRPQTVLKVAPRLNHTLHPASARARRGPQAKFDLNASGTWVVAGLRGAEDRAVFGMGLADVQGGLLGCVSGCFGPNIDEYFFGGMVGGEETGDGVCGGSRGGEARRGGRGGGSIA